MKYASEILGLMRPYPGREFRMSQLVREVTGGRTLTPRQMEAVRKGVKRVLDHLIDTEHVERIGGTTRAAMYAWRLLGREVPRQAGLLGHPKGQYVQGRCAP